MELKYTPKVSLLDEQGCQAIHRASLKILEKNGLLIYHPEALELFKKKGAIVEGNLVKLKPEMVEWALGKAPSRICLYRRGTEEIGIDLSGNIVNFGTGSDCPYFLDPKTQERRKPKPEDLAATYRLADALPNIGFVMSTAIPDPNIVPTTQQYRRQYALMVQNTTKPIVFVCDGRKDCEDITEMACLASGCDMEHLRKFPTVLLYTEPSSPLKYSDTALEKILFMAEHGLPVVNSPTPLCGATTPITIAGTLAISNAEVLSGLLLAQLKREGAPIVYGTGITHLDMRTTTTPLGDPEFQLGQLLIQEMGKYYKLPTWSYAGPTDSVVMDQQAAADACTEIRDALMFGANLVHDFGFLETAMTNSPEMMVFCDLMVDMHRHFMKGITINEETLALDVLDQVGGPGGNFFETDHTMQHYKEFWYPRLFNRQRIHNWEKQGSKSCKDLCREKALQLMEKHAVAPLPDDVVAAIEKVVIKERN